MPRTGYTGAVNTTQENAHGVLHRRVRMEDSEPGSEAFPLTLTKFLANEQISSEVMVLGGVYVNDKRARDPQQVLNNGDLVRIHSRPRRYASSLPAPLGKVVWENSDLLAVLKPSHLPCIPMVDNWKENLWYLLEDRHHQRLYVTHRLDVATSGLMIYAKTPSAQAEFNQLLSRGQIKKIYSAWSTNPHARALPVGELIHWMKKSDVGPKILRSDAPSVSEESNWQICRLRILETQQERLVVPLSRFNLELLTGRTQQIRAQLAFEGFPIVGDFSYGGVPWIDAMPPDFFLSRLRAPSPYAFPQRSSEQIALHAESLEFFWRGEKISLRILE